MRDGEYYCISNMMQIKYFIKFSLIMFKFCNIFISFPSMCIANFINCFAIFQLGSFSKFTLIKCSLGPTVTQFNIAVNRTQILRKS